MACLTAGHAAGSLEQAMDDLYDKIARGMTNVEDAERYARLVARCEAYELALREIAGLGISAAGMIAAQVLAGDVEGAMNTIRVVREISRMVPDDDT